MQLVYICGIFVGWYSWFACDLFRLFSILIIFKLKCNFYTINDSVNLYFSIAFLLYICHTHLIVIRSGYLSNLMIHQDDSIL